VAVLALLHVLVLRTFYLGAGDTCLDVRLGSRRLDEAAAGWEDRPAGRRIAARHAAWAQQTPQDPAEAWAFVLSLDGDSRQALLAHCVALSVDAVRDWRARSASLRHADQLAQALALDMTGDWRASAEAYLGRVTKARILEAVDEAAGPEAAARLAELRKAEMVAAAEPLVMAADWLPPLLRTPPVEFAPDDRAAA
jgi:ParB family chromosome partitioning protein